MIAEKILELKHLGLSAPKIAEQLNISMYETMKVFDYKRWRKSWFTKTKKIESPRQTDEMVKKVKKKTDSEICKTWILNKYEKSLSYTNVIEIYKSYEYYILNVHNLNHNENLNPVSTNCFRKLLKECGFSDCKKAYGKIVNTWFNCERKAL